MTRGIGRRHLLTTGAAAIGGTAVGWGTRGVVDDPAAPAGAAAEATPAVLGGDVEPFHGVHQAGITTVPQAQTSLLGLDLLADPDAPGAPVDLDALARLLRLLSDDASRLTAGGGALADTEPELAVRPARLTVTFGFGPRVLASLRPAYDPGLEPLPEFTQDALDPAWGQTDLLVQVSSDDPVSVAHARRMLLKDAAPFTRTTWVQEGFRRARGSDPEGTTMRNLMGQVDGTVNLPTADQGRLLWSTGRAAGFDGGTFLVVRRIAMDMVDWDRTDRVAREFSVGRRLADGAPLTGGAEHDEPDFEATDAAGFPVIDPASHVRRARSDDPEQQFLRRGYNYSLPTGETGLLFLAYAADLARQFVPVQARLDELDLLNEWVTAIGSAVYAVPPACVEGDFVGREMLGLPPPTVSGSAVPTPTSPNGDTP